MKVNTYSKSIYILIILFCIFIYFYFNINIHMHESYVYSLGTEGFIDIKQSHIISSPWLLEYPPFNGYHPCHPTLNFISSYIQTFFRNFNINLSVIKIISTINTCCGLITGLYFYYLLTHLNFSQMRATLASVLLIFSGIFWYSSLSAESYVTGQLFNIISIYYLFKSQSNKKYIYLSLIFLGFSLSIHSIYSLMVIPHLYFLTTRIKERSIVTILKYYSILVPFVVTVYIAPLVFLLKASSISEMIKLFLFYSDEMGVWTYHYQGAWEAIKKIFIEPIFSGLFHMSYSFIEGMTLISGLLRLVFVLLFLFSFLRIKKFSKDHTNFMRLYFSVYFVLTAYILHLPYDITYWIFASPAIIYFILISLGNRNTLILITALVIFLNNFLLDILPKNKVDLSQYFFTDKIFELSKDTNKIQFIINDSKAQTSYLNYYGVINQVREDKRLQSKLESPIIDEYQLEERIKGLLLKNSVTLIIYNPTYDHTFENKIDPIINKLGGIITGLPVLERVFDPKLDKTSEMEHEPWYKFSQLNQTWELKVLKITVP